MYICEFCKKRQATIHLTDIHNNVKKEVHMCDQCAQTKGFSTNQALSVNLPQIFSSVVKNEPKKEKKPREEDIVCNSCGISWREFRKGGRFGCPGDYDSFRPRLRGLLADIHAGAAHHAGKTPPGKGIDPKLRNEIIVCRRELRNAIDNEAYELAAELRDRLSELSEKIKAEK
jgi:protein arginine kinase activator